MSLKHAWRWDKAEAYRVCPCLPGRSMEAPAKPLQRPLARACQQPSTMTAPIIEAISPAPWSGPYQWIARPIKVATTLPTMPNTVVRMNPCGLFGEGEIQRAMNPAIAPITIAQIICMLRLLNKGPGARRKLHFFARTINRIASPEISGEARAPTHTLARGRHLVGCQPAAVYSSRRARQSVVARRSRIASTREISESSARTDTSVPPRRTPSS